jgi:hypothetical protein
MYRRNFRINKVRESTLGLVSSIFLTSLIPAASGAALLAAYFMDDMLTATDEKCSMCRELRGLGIHFAMGNLVPTGLAWVTNMYQASIYNSRKIPSLDHAVANFRDKTARGFYFDQMKKLFRETNKGVGATLVANYSLQIFTCAALFHFQFREFKDYIEPSQFTLAEIRSIKKVD